MPLTDDVMVWISQVIGQDVNIFRGPHLLATSERDLFASGQLPTRTPAEALDWTFRPHGTRSGVVDSIVVARGTRRVQALVPGLRAQLELVP